MALNNPNINFEIKSALQKEKNEAQKVLLVGQMSSGSATAGVVVENVGNLNEQDILFGADSMAANMVRAFKRVNIINRVDVLPLADGAASIAAVGNVIFSGTASENGTIYVRIGSKLHATYELNVAKDDTADDVGAALVALIAADTKSIVTSANTTGDVELTAVNKGATGNFIGIWVTGTITNITYSITKMASGTGEPDNIDAVLNAVDEDVRYQAVIWEQTYDVANDYAALSTFLNNRFPANNIILDGAGFIGITDTLANLKILAAAVDQKVINLDVNKPVSVSNEYEGAAIFELDYIIPIYFAAIRALRMTDGAQIGKYIIGGQGALDDIGGMALASLPYMNTPFTNLLSPAIPLYFWKNEEIAELLAAGLSIIGNNRQNNDVIAGQMVTTYLTNPAGNADNTFRFLNYFDTFTNIREYFFDNLKARYKQSRLTTGDLTPLRNEANVASIETSLLGIYRDLEDAVLVKRGREAEKFFKDNLTVSIDKISGLVTITMSVNPVVQLRQFDIVMQVSFD